MEKGRICYVISSFPYFRVGGAEVQLYYLAQEMLKRKWEVHFMTLGAEGQRLTEFIDGIVVHAAEHGAPAGLRNITDRIKLFKLLDKPDADIYHQRCLGTLTFFTGLFCKLNNRKFVATAAAIDEASLKLPLVKRELARMGLGMADKVTTLADYMKKEMEKFVGNVQVIPNGYPIVEVSHKRKDIILWVGRMIPSKNPEKFVELAKSVDGKCVMCGDGQLLEKIKGVAKGVKNLEIVGGVDFLKMREYYSRAKVLVSTSSIEGFPSSFVEAWSQGTPVVSFIDPDRVIENNRLGRVASENNLAEAVKAVLRGKTTGKRCLAYARKHHNIENTADAYEKIYKVLTK